MLRPPVCSYKYISNFATIFGPNLFRCPADSLPPASSVNDRDVTHVPRQFINSGFEIQFVLSLIRNLVPSEFDALVSRIVLSSLASYQSLYARQSLADLLLLI